MARKYMKKSCHGTKTAAKGAARKMRLEGLTATVRKSGKKFCVFSAGKSKVKRSQRQKITLT